MEPVESHPAKQELVTFYGEICQSYRGVDDLRMKLLGFLPLVTGAGLLTLTGGGDEIPGTTVTVAAGVFGLLVSLGLFALELHGIKKCASLIDAGRLIEEEVGINGQFTRRPPQVAGLVDEPFAASVIYPASLAAWTYFAILSHPVAAFIPAALVFILGLIGSQQLIRRMKDDLSNRIEYDREPWLNRGPTPTRDVPSSATT